VKFVLALITFVTAVLVVGGNPGSVTNAQRRPGQRRPAPRSTPKPAHDYSIFKHEDHRKDARGKQLECSSCHLITSPTQPDRISASTKPNGKSSFPYHDSCFGCHREQVYRGDKPQICTVCHTQVSPRATANDLYAHFPSPKLGDAITREFPGYYPHGLHESVFALNRLPDANRRGLFAQVSFTRPVTEAASSDICAACHATDDRGVMPLPGAVPADATFKQIEGDTFRTIPGFGREDGHATCFNCHWQAQKPTRDDCNGCHLATADYQKRTLTIIQPPALSTNAISWFKGWPKDVPKRFSLKFRHNTHTRSPDSSEANNHDLGCTTCHINIAQMTTLNIPKADVPIAACGPCHSSLKEITTGPGAGETIYSEITKKQDASKKYTCVACHTSLIGREPPPCSHYQVIGQPCPAEKRVARR
jgi:hypothetical protein